MTISAERFGDAIARDFGTVPPEELRLMPAVGDGVRERAGVRVVGWFCRNIQPRKSVRSDGSNERSAQTASSAGVMSRKPIGFAGL